MARKGFACLVAHTQLMQQQYWQPLQMARKGFACLVAHTQLMQQQYWQPLQWQEKGLLVLLHTHNCNNNTSSPCNGKKRVCLSCCTHTINATTVLAALAMARKGFACLVAHTQLMQQQYWQPLQWQEKGLLVLLHTHN